jgi:hypothetical protein
MGRGAFDSQADSSKPMTYQIRIAGQLGSRWEDWFEGLAITLDGSDTLITGPVVDQAALHGLLKKVRDLGMPLVSVGPVEPGPSTTLGQAGRMRQTSGRTLARAACPRPRQSRKGDRE